MIINCKGKALDLSSPKIMGILNITTDSFFKNSRLNTKDSILYQAEKMIKEGAAILDVGGVSSRPLANDVSVDLELQRVVPTIELLQQYFPNTILSVDSYQAKVASEAIDAGASILNDISSWNINADLLEVLAKNRNVPYVLMHMQGIPKNMQQNPHYEDLLVDIMDFFIKKISILKQYKVKDIILDLGFGFGKTIEHNYTLLKKMHLFQSFKLPILVGLSRKSMIYKLLDITPATALNGTSILHLKALQEGANILRVHDVKEANEAIKLWQKLN